MLKFTANLSLLFNEVELIQRFRLAKQHGFNAVEIQFPYALDAKSILHTLTENEQKLILFNVDADDLLQGGEGLACVPEKRHQFLRAVEKAVNYAEILKPEAINILPGCCRIEHKKPAYRDTFLENLRYASDIFAALGIKTVFEAINTIDIPGFIIHNEQQMLAILNELKHPNLFMQYDIYHMQMMEQKPEAFIATNAAAIGHIQFADCPGRGQPGTGQLHFEHIFNAIEASAYSGWIGAEYLPQGPSIESLTWFRTQRALNNLRSF
ncbi:MAG: TIM barrel protein [Methylococcaceae bacterium]|nr:TIM barrel protein [Methylococcaceae bacterium]